MTALRHIITVIFKYGIYMKMILIFSHSLTEEQINDAIGKLNITEFVYMPQILQDIWSNIPASVHNMKQYLSEIHNFIINNSSKNDYILIQGDFGATYNTVNFCKDNERITIYSTTKRQSKEIYRDNTIEKISYFSHLSFREYQA